MKIDTERNGSVVLVFPQGRLDAFGSGEFQKAIVLPEEVSGVVLDMTGVEYLSSAGLRVFVMLYKDLQCRGGALALSNLQTYCRQVIDIAGFSGTFPIFSSNAQALAHCQALAAEKELLDRWEALEMAELPCGRVRILPSGAEAGAIEILGDINDVLMSRVTRAHLSSKRFSETEFSLGLGGLGDRVDDYFPIMGEMITVGGTMVWLPTDGHDTPDFLIPGAVSGEVLLRTGFNVSIAGKFNELMYFESNDARGATMTEIYRALFDLSKRRRPDYKGALGLALRAQVGAVFGSGVKKSPIQEFAPENGEAITHPSNFETWFEYDKAPRHCDVTGLICGAGIDLTCDLSAYSQPELKATFYLNPANTGSKTELLHNHGVFFTEIPMAERAANLDREIRNVVQKGDFIDMRHLLDATTVTRGLIGVNYIQEFRRDGGARAGH